MRLLPITLIALIAGAVVPARAHAFILDPAWVAARGGTLGAGGEFAVQIVPTLTVRAIGQGYSFDYNESLDGVDYAGSLDLGSLGAQLDFRPPLSPIYVTAGVFANNNGLDLRATPAAAVQIGSNTYSPAQLGTITTKADWGDQALYAGLGMELSLGPVSAALEGGLYYQGEPSVTFAASGPAAQSAQFLTDVVREQDRIADELDTLRYWPAVTITARWKF